MIDATNSPIRSAKRGIVTHCSSSTFVLFGHFDILICAAPDGPSIVSLEPASMFGPKWVIFDLDGTLTKRAVMAHVGDRVGFGDAARQALSQYENAPPGTGSNPGTSRWLAQLLRGARRDDLVVASSLEYSDDGAATGSVHALEAKHKLIEVERICQSDDVTIAAIAFAGNGRSDVHAVRSCGVSIAFNASRAIEELACLRADSTTLHDALPADADDCSADWKRRGLPCAHERRNLGTSPRYMSHWTCWTSTRIDPPSL